MIMKVVINIPYQRHRNFIQSLPYRNDMFGTILQNKRNTISIIDMGGEKWIAKRFKCPTPFNRFAYTFLRKSKAERAYRNAFQLLAMGYDTPTPIAYIESRKYLLYHTGYYICRWSPYDLIENIDKLDNRNQTEILTSLAEYTLDMHNDGIYFYDYNAGNIMYHREDGAWKFTLIDVNRIKFYRHKLSLHKSIEVLKHLNLSPLQTEHLLYHYARLRGLNWKILSGVILLKQGVNLSVRIRIFFKRLLGIK